jgi:hypothetical protein
MDAIAASAPEIVQQHIAIGAVQRRDVRHAFFQLNVTRHPKPAAHCSRRAHKVRLNGPGDQQHIRARQLRVAQIVFQLPNFVAAKPYARAVIALHKQRKTEVAPKVRHGLQRGRQMPHSRAWEAFERGKRPLAKSCHCPPPKECNPLTASIAGDRA